MHFTVQNLNNIKNQIKLKLNKINNDNSPKIIAVSKTFSLEKILPLIEYGHKDFGENKVQESIDKWSEFKFKNTSIKLHLIGKLQSNKVKLAVKIFDYIHSVDSEKLAKKIAEEIEKQNKQIKIFLQVNIGKEDQKSGVDIEKLDDLYDYCKVLNLNVVGLMCIPPLNENPKNFFLEMQNLKKKYNLNEISMGMSSDYIEAVEYSATFLRIGSSIFGPRD